jgi:hypothetical protein
MDLSDDLADSPAAGDSREQREAESVLIRALSVELGAQLSPARPPLPAGGRVEIDGVAQDHSILVEAWAHQGPPKRAQAMKVINDAFQLSFTAETMAGTSRLILLFSDPDAARPFQGNRWFAQAIRARGVESRVVTLPVDLQLRVRAAEARQFR